MSKLNNYRTVTQADKFFSIYRYFLSEWLPLLPSPAYGWFLIAAQQRAVLPDGNSDVSPAALGQDIGVSAETIQKFLAHPLTRSFGGFRKDEGLIVDAPPLSPTHQAGLAAMLAAVPSLDLKQWVEQRNLRQLLTQSATEQSPLCLPGGMVWDVLKHVNQADIAPDTRQLCELIHHRIVHLSSFLMLTEYFRLKWVPLLGHEVAWLIALLRSQCFIADGTLVNTVSFEKQALARRLGISLDVLYEAIKSEHCHRFFSVVEQDESSISFEVQPWYGGEPLTPEDEAVLSQNKDGLPAGYVDFWTAFLDRK